MIRQRQPIPTPASVAEAVERGVPVVVVEKAVDRESILYTLEMIVSEASMQINIDARLNVQAHQTRPIAEAILSTFRAESIEDFKLAFRNGVNGLYGEIFRLDGAVLTKWIQCYLDQKYAHIETELAKEKHKENDSQVDYRAFIERRKSEGEAATEAKRKDIEKRRQDALYQMEKGEYKPLDEKTLASYQTHNEYVWENYDERYNKLPTWKSKEEWLKSREAPQAAPPELSPPSTQQETP